MHNLVRGIWAQWPEDMEHPALTPWEIAAVLQPLWGPTAAVSGTCAASILQIPLMTGLHWVDELLGEPAIYGAPPACPQLRTREVPRSRERDRTQVHVHRGFGLAPQRGPWGCAVTGPLETVLQLQPWIHGWRTTAAVDHILSKNLGPDGTSMPLPSEAFLQAVKALPRGTRGKARLAMAASRCAANTWSPMETVLRLAVESFGVHAPEPNHCVHLPSGRTVYLDLAWPHLRKALEYNGAVHFQDRTTYGDEMHRFNALRSAGWEIYFVVAEDLKDRQRRRALRRWLATHVGP
ncbi:hypothetical protein FCK90_04130 [Kocuria coralli]|uniref:DUF559 domain-containing protein n=1 Tax=Kocuria coralli TaxID=1461025 RepID=A0A5J5L0F4_9MICC|nr:hypothetical protein [Kocuria coralli]KAA9395100.1 hypothetical protein FCK90_04130 [Kocuria coralli]